MGEWRTWGVLRRTVDDTGRVLTVLMVLRFLTVLMVLTVGTVCTWAWGTVLTKEIPAGIPFENNDLDKKINIFV